MARAINPPAVHSATPRKGDKAREVPQVVPRMQRLKDRARVVLLALGFALFFYAGGYLHRAVTARAEIDGLTVTLQEQRQLRSLVEVRVELLAAQQSLAAENFGDARAHIQTARSLGSDQRYLSALGELDTTDPDIATASINELLQVLDQKLAASLR